MSTRICLVQYLVLKNWPFKGDILFDDQHVVWMLVSTCCVRGLSQNPTWEYEVDLGLHPSPIHEQWSLSQVEGFWSMSFLFCLYEMTQNPSHHPQVWGKGHVSRIVFHKLLLHRFAFRVCTHFHHRWNFLCFILGPRSLLQPLLLMWEFLIVSYTLWSTYKIAPNGTCSYITRIQLNGLALLIELGWSPPILTQLVWYA